jgi:transcription antitermination protein NusB
MSKGTRRQGREMALKLLYSLPDHEGGSLEEVLADFWGQFEFRNDVLGEAEDKVTTSVRPEVRHFAESLVFGVSENLEQIDKSLAEFSTNWALDRMARVDLALLRLAAYELLCTADVPANVVINEAIEVGKRFGTSETSKFINGILDPLARTIRKPGL